MSITTFLAALTPISSWLAAPAAPPSIDPPRVLRPDLELQLFASEPDIVTPVQIAIDERGRVWAIESNTHFPKPEYARHPSDRILVIEDTNGDGKADRFDVFADGFQQTMAIALGGKGKLFVATRREVSFLEDVDGDGYGEKKTTLARLESVEQYPHNGLSGFAFDQDSWVYFAIGENMAIPYRLTGSDGSVVTGGPEGGSVFRMRKDGSRLERWAVGFWNTFHMTFDGQGHLFAVDNDPDSRPPCRLLHIVRGGDYGYRRWLGRKGLHPFTAWNGELPGTMPMVSGTGEAPSGIVSYERTGPGAFPSDLRQKLLVTSWGDHRIETYTLEERGASFRSRPVPIVQGGEMFRPVGIAIAPDDSVYFSDWVDQDYHVHMKGRIWRLKARPRAVQPAGEPAPRVVPAGAADAGSPVGRLAALEAMLDGTTASASPSQAAKDVFDLMGTDRDPFLECIGIGVLAKSCGAGWLLHNRTSPEPRKRLHILLALRRTGDPAAQKAIDDALADPDLEVRRAAIQWVGEERLKDHGESLERAFQRGPVSIAIFDAYLAAKSLLDGEAPDARDTIARDEVLSGIARDTKRPAPVRALALRSIRAGFPGLGAKDLKGFLAESDPSIRLEAARALRDAPAPETEAWLVSLAENESEPVPLRREAIAGLTRHLPAAEAALKRIAESGGKDVRAEAARALRLGSAPIVSGKALSAEQKTSLLEGGDPVEGELLFFYPRGARCASCHSIRGRGGVAGPDLSAAGNTPRAKLLESILEPQKEIAPQFATWVFTTRSGLRSGTWIGEGSDGSLQLANADGAVESIPAADVESRELSATSLMPEGIASPLELGELRDLLAYLSSLKEGSRSK